MRNKWDGNSQLSNNGSHCCHYENQTQLMSTKCITWKTYCVWRGLLIVGHNMTPSLLSAQQVCTETWLRRLLGGLATHEREARTLTILSHVGLILSQQTRIPKPFWHCWSLQMGTPIKIPANRSVRTRSKFNYMKDFGNYKNQDYQPP